jgi:hypothetical protein
MLADFTTFYETRIRADSQVNGTRMLADFTTFYGTRMLADSQVNGTRMLADHVAPSDGQA